jgi:ribose-phosphate pyrophosphokinase
MNIIGDVRGKTCVLIDDLVDTAGTLCHAAEALKQEGAVKVVAYATHAVFSGPAVDNISGSELDEVVVTNSIPLSIKAQQCSKIRQLSVAQVLANTMLHINQDQSVSDLFCES